jgi:tetratricopeptide (TPR) repeat protein
LKSRLQALAKMVIGLAYYSLRDYPKALEVYQSTDSIDGWANDQGKNVLYLLMGNAAGRQGNVDLAERYYQQSLAVDPDYARPYIGLGSVFYLRALKPFNASKKPADTDQGWLDKSIETYQRALMAPTQPAVADVSTKVHFGLGQAYFMQAYSGHAITFDAAVAEFQQVIAAYANGINPRVKEWAAESHARLGLIYDLAGHVQESISEYETAASLLSEDPDRSTQYYQRAQLLKQTLLTPTP